MVRWNHNLVGDNSEWRGRCHKPRPDLGGSGRQCVDYGRAGEITSPPSVDLEETTGTGAPIQYR